MQLWHSVEDEPRLFGGVWWNFQYKASEIPRNEDNTGNVGFSKAF
jgi:hypothetical protein